RRVRLSQSRQRPARHGASWLPPRRQSRKLLITKVRRMFAASHKPNSVPAGPLRVRRGDDHSSSPAITGEIKRPTRKLRTGRPRALPYLVLLRAGFCLPPVLPPARCALTAPFHPYSPPPGGPGEGKRYVFCATVLQVTLTGRYPAHCPAEFGLSSLLRSPTLTSRRATEGKLPDGACPP